jgi:hypothetical protein
MASKRLAPAIPVLAQDNRIKLIFKVQGQK